MRFKAKEFCEKIGDGLRAKNIFLIFYILTALALPLYYAVKKISFLGSGWVWLIAVCFLTGAAVGSCILTETVKRFEITFYDHRLNYKVWAGVFFLSFIVLLVWYTGYYPGFFTPDSFAQLGQAVSGDYSDWHPVIHTILMFTVPLKLTGGWIGSVVLFQIFVFSLALGYAGASLMQYSNWKFTLTAVLVILLSPVTGMTCLYPWKDVFMSVCGLVSMSFAVKVYFSKGEWLNSAIHVVLCVFFIVFTSLARHNAILFTLPLLAGMLLYAGRKKRLQIIAVMLLTVFCIKVPLYSILEVEKPEDRQMEILGLPMTIIGNAVVEHPEALNAETKEFAYRFADPKNWNGYYTVGNFNGIKWSGQADFSIIEETGAASILKMMLHCMYKAPLSATKAIVVLTRPVYSLDRYSAYYQITETVDEYGGFPYGGNRYIMSFLDAYKTFIYDSPLRYIFCYTGILNLIIIVFILEKTNLRLSEDRKRLLLCIPVLVYNFGTMLLLSGRDDRYFYLTFLVWPAEILIMSGRREGATT